MNSILNSVKQMLGVPLDDDAYDNELIIYINGVMSILNELGVGPDDAVIISSASDTWDELLLDEYNLVLVKTYVYMKVKIIFDPPTNSTHLNALNESIKEYETRINYFASKG